MTKRAVLYARVSGDDRGKDGRNLAGQIEMCREYCLKMGWLVVAELSEDDRGASGAAFELPRLNQVREMAKENEFDVLVVREIDRLSRKLVKQLIAEEELRRNGVNVEYVIGEYENSPEGNLMKHVRATIAEYEREKIRERIIRGRRQKIKSGSILSSGRTAYGLRAVDKDGLTSFEIVESEAKIIRMIFEWYTRGNDLEGPLSIKAIARKLSELSIPTYGDLHPDKTWRKRGACKWNPNSVRKILLNETYAGVWKYGEGSELGVQTVKVPAIIDRQTWEFAQNRRSKNQQRAKRNRKHHYLLAGHIRCGHCQASMAGSTFYPDGKMYQYYICRVKRTPKDHDISCDLPSFRVEQVDCAVWNWVGSVIFNPEKLDKGIKLYREGQKQKNTPMRERLEIVNELIEENQKQYDRLIDLYVRGDVPVEMLTERKNRLETNLKALKKEQHELAISLESNHITEAQVMSIKETVAKLNEGYTAVADDYKAKRQILDILDVEVLGAVENGEKVLYVRCVLSGKDFVTVPTTINGCAVLKDLRFCMRGQRCNLC